MSAGLQVVHTCVLGGREREVHLEIHFYKGFCLCASLHPKLVWIGSPKKIIIIYSPVPSACAHNLAKDRSKTVL
jgi:hypothetical protein